MAENSASGYGSQLQTEIRSHANGRADPFMHCSNGDHARALRDIREAADRHGVSAEGVEDATLLRFLRARSMHTEKAAKMFVQHQKWRASFVPLGYIPERVVERELAHGKICLQGNSKKAWPIMVVLAGKHHPNKDDFQEFKRFVVHMLDKTIASAPEGIEKIMVIVDLDDLGFKNIDIKGMITGFQFLQNYFPERLARLYMVNTPSLFQSAWKVVSRFLDKATKEKIMFLGNREMPGTLLSEVDATILPSRYGGKAEFVLLQDVHLENWPPKDRR